MGGTDSFNCASSNDLFQEQQLAVQNHNNQEVNNNQENPSGISSPKRRKIATDVSKPDDVNCKTVVSKEFLYKDMLSFTKETRVLMHKVNILCLIAYGNKVNDIINDDFVKAGLLSLVPSPLIPTDPVDIDYLLDLIEWYKCVFMVSNVNLESTLDYKNFKNVFLTRRVICLRDYIMLFTSLLRALGCSARFVMSLHPYPINVDDFEIDPIPPFDDDFLNPADYTITLKKGRGYVKSRKGKDILAPEAVKRILNPPPIPPGEREKFIMMKYKKILACAVKRKRIKLDNWVEVYVPTQRKWMPVNIIHQTVNDIDSVYDNLTLPLKYCVAWTNDNYIEDITKEYAPDWFKGTSKKRIDKLWVDETFAMFAEKKSPRKLFKKK